MTDKVDQRFQDLLRRAGPAERDPAFRLRVLEQRERERFRRASAIHLLAALTVAGLAGAAALLHPAPLFAAGAALFAMAATAAGLLHAPAMLAELRRLRF